MGRAPSMMTEPAPPISWPRFVGPRIALVATGVMCGLGPFGYIAALHAVANMK